MYHRISRHSHFESWWKRQRQIYLLGRWHDHPQCALWGECLTAYQRFEQANGCICGHRLFAEHRWSLVGDSGFTGRRLSSCHQLDGHYRPTLAHCHLHHRLLPLQQTVKLQSCREGCHFQLPDSCSRSHHLLPLPGRNLLLEVCVGRCFGNNGHIHY